MFFKLDGAMVHLSDYNCALAYAMKGDFINSTVYLNKLEGKNLQFDERQLRAQAQIYSSNGKNEKAISLLEASNQRQNNNPFDMEIRELKRGKTLRFDGFKTPSDAFASVFYLMGSAGDEKTRNLTASVFYIQLAEFMSGQKDYYNLRLAEMFARMQAFSYSIKKYKKIPSESTFYLRAQLGIIDVLVDDSQNDKATLVIQDLIEKGFNEFALFEALANIFRANEDYDAAITYYDKALGKLDKEIKPNAWVTFFVRGISYDQSGNWEKAKIDLNAALQLYPNHPEVLNYFGYSLIERNERLDEALGMIKDAVAQKPESGYIIDSLAWGLFQLGNYQEAIIPMEKAIELEPHDPIINDHLGDILWMIGRKREANFQWKRALFFEPTHENEEKIKRKLLFGLTDS
jgi:Flp pilus assembly protein TadD